MNPKLFVLGCIGIWPFTGLTQEVVTTTGDYFETPEVTISWTIGELMTASFETEEVHLTQGQQQSTFAYANIPDQETQPDIVVYPNPFTDLFMINTNGAVYQFTIHDAAGSLILEGQIDPGQTELNLDEVANGIYYLKIHSGTHEKSFKLIKH